MDRKKYLKKIGALIMTLASSAMGATAKESATADEKFIVVGEKIIATNPWRNDLIKHQYRVAIDEALKDHKKKFPKSKVRLIESYDDGPSDGFKIAESKNAFGVVGYLYSMEAFEAATIASKRKIPYLSPVSPLNSVMNDFSFSMASSHGQMVAALKELRKNKGFDNPSIVLMPDTFLPNFEYEKAYRNSFNVVDTLKGKSPEVWGQLEKKLKDLPQEQTLNILLAGFAFEQMDLAKMLSTGPFAKRIKIIAHAQWNYCPRLLAASLSADTKNLYVVTDYFNFDDLSDLKKDLPKQSLERFASLHSTLKKEPSIKRHNIDEPVVYVLKDMISIALLAAEKSLNREEYNLKYSTIQFEGASAFYKFDHKISEKKVYLGQWDSNKIKLIKAL